MNEASSQQALENRERALRVAALDLGTNTFLCLIADIVVQPDGSALLRRVLRDEMKIVRLGQGVDAAKALHPEALKRAEYCFREFSLLIAEAGVEKTVAVATSATRDAVNGHELIKLGSQYGIPIQIISGEQEAEYTFKGTLEPHWNGLTAVIDVGGGSTEVIVGDQGGIFLRFSANVGSVRLTEKYVSRHPISQGEYGEMEDQVRRSLSDGLQAALKSFNGVLAEMPKDKKLSEYPLTLNELKSRISRFIAVAGTPTTLAAVLRKAPFSNSAVQGFHIPVQKLESLTLDLACQTVEQRQSIEGMEPKRADVIVAGAICLKEAAQLLEAKELEVSVRGLRYGILGGLT